MVRRVFILMVVGAVLLPAPAGAALMRGGARHPRTVSVRRRHGVIVDSAIGRVRVPDGFDACARRVPVRVVDPNGGDITEGHGRTDHHGHYNLSYRGPRLIEVVARAVRRDGDLCRRATGHN
jgi:hypothetical protein